MSNKDKISQNEATPDIFVKAVEDYFQIKFAWDLAASAENAKAKNYYTEADNAFLQDWPTKGWSWLNPPFFDLKPWVQNCIDEKNRGCKFITIWPLSGDLNVMPSWIHAQVNVIHGRIWPTVRGCMVCVWNNDPKMRKAPRGLRWDKKELTRIW